MKETNFIRQNQEKWEDFEKQLQQKDPNPDKLSELFIQVTDDLAFSRTFYANRSVRVYLNSLAQRVYLNIYKNKKEKLGRFKDFFAEELPQIVYHSRKAFLLSISSFLLFVFIGVASTIYEPGFTSSILGADYVSMTESNIAKGDPMAVYKHMNEVDMFLGITLNNMRVSFLTFASGIVFSVGSIGVMLYNGIMVGTFQYFFVQKGLFWESFLTIWLHGSIEIPAIVIAGAAGIVMGNGLVFPGTLTRMQSFQLSARKGIKIMLGVAVMIVLAGFIEGFITRHNDVPDFVKAVFIIVCFSSVIFYFGVYPFVLHRRGFKKPLSAPQLPPDMDERIDFKKIKDNGEVFMNVFQLLRRHSGKAYGFLAACALFYSVLSLIVQESFPSAKIPFYIGNISWHDTFLLFDYERFPWQIFLNTVFMAAILLHSLHLVGLTNPQKKDALLPFWRFSLRYGLPALFGSSFINAMLLMPDVLSHTAFLVILPFVALSLAAYTFGQHSLLSAFQKGSKMLGAMVMQTLWLNLSFLILGLMSMLLMASPFFSFYSDVIDWNLALTEEFRHIFFQGVFVFFVGFLAFVTLLCLFIAAGIHYFSLTELLDAPALSEAVANMGKRKTAYGLEREG